MNKQPTCEERIDAHLESTLDDIRQTSTYTLECQECNHEWSGKEDEPCPKCDSYNVETLVDPDENREHYMEGVLEIAKLHTVFRVGLSWGGPADGFYLYVDEDGTVEKAEFYFQDWFDGAKRVLHGDDLQIVCNMFESWCQLSQ